MGQPLKPKHVNDDLRMLFSNNDIHFFRTVTNVSCYTFVGFDVMQSCSLQMQETGSFGT